MPASPIPPPTPSFYGIDDTVFEVALHEPEGTAAIPEGLIQDLWHTRRFQFSDLVTTDGDPVTVLHPGTLNSDSGPDFSNVRLRIGEIEWAGDVEVHVTSGGWIDHKHHLDPGYNQVVLHVVLHADIWTGSLRRADGSLLPEVTLYPYLDASLRSLLYSFYTREADTLACARSWPGVPAPLKHQWIDALAAERLRAKTRHLTDAYLRRPDLVALLHERLFAALGYAKNDEPMAELARRLPLSLVRRVSDPLDVEALHLGVAGLLPGPADLLGADRQTADYAMDLYDRFARLQLDLDLPVMPHRTWRFFRLRPVNFPPLRIAQAVALVLNVLRHDPLTRLLAALRKERPVTALRRMLRATPGPFWETHFRMEKATKPRDPAIGRNRCDALIINAVAPSLLLHAEHTGDPALERAVFDLLRALPAERDEVIRRFAALGTRPENALAAQGLHQLYRTRCTEGRCLSCKIGQSVLGSS